MLRQHPSAEDWYFCVPHYAGIGARAQAIEALLDHPDLEVVRADPQTQQPSYY